MRKQELLAELGFSKEFLQQLDDYAEPTDVSFEEIGDVSHSKDFETIETTELKLSQRQTSSNDYHYQS